jgi:tRNA nucleotidyltransferase (CCA-adding enzyme)
MGNLASERILGEMEKALLKAEKPSIFFETLRLMDQLHDWFPELEALIGVAQSEKFHPEGDVWTHTMMVLDVAASLKDETTNPMAFMLVALCHDFGKAVATSVDETGKVTAYDHEKLGLPLVEAFLDRVVKNNSVKAYVLNLVELHMRPNQIPMDCKVKATNNMFDLACNPMDLVLFAQADHMGRLNPPCYEERQAFLMERLAQYQAVKQAPAVTGKDLIAAGLKPGKAFGELLELAHKLQLSGLAKEQALAQVLATAKTLG